MGRKCFVQNCKTGYDTCGEKLSLFRVPNCQDRGELIKKWQFAIPRRDRKLSLKDYVCEKHFQPGDIIRAWQFYNITVSLIFNATN